MTGEHSDETLHVIILTWFGNASEISYYNDDTTLFDSDDVKTTQTPGGHCAAKTRVARRGYVTTYVMGNNCTIM